MRKLLAIGAALLLALTISACGGDDDDDDAGDGGGDTTEAMATFRQGVIDRGWSEETADCVVDGLLEEFPGIDTRTEDEGMPDGLQERIGTITPECAQETGDPALESGGGEEEPVEEETEE